MALPPAWPLRIFALLLVCAYGFGASESFQESSHGEVVDELMQRGHQRHLLQEPPDAKATPAGKGGAPAATGAEGESPAEKTSGAGKSEPPTNAPTAPSPEAQAAKFEMIKCELRNSRAETKLMGIADKTEPLAAKIKKSSVTFATARAKYDKIRMASADKQRRKFSQEYLDIKTEKVRISTRAFAEMKYMNKYVDLYETLARQSSELPMVHKNIAAAKEELLKKLASEREITTAVSNGKARRHALIAELPLQKQAITRSYTKSLIATRFTDLQLANKIQKDQGDDAAIRKAMQPLELALDPLKRDVKDHEKQIESKMASTKADVKVIVHSAATLDSRKWDMRGRIKMKRIEEKDNQDRERAKKKMRINSELLVRDKQHAGMQKKELAFKAQEEAQQLAYEKKETERNAAVMLAQKEHNALIKKLGEATAKAKAQVDAAETAKEKDLIEAKNFYTERLNAVKAKHGDTPDQKAGQKAALKGEKEKVAIKKKIMKEIPGDPNKKEAKKEAKQAGKKEEKKEAKQEAKKEAKQAGKKEAKKDA